MWDNPLCGHVGSAIWKHWLGGGPRSVSFLVALQLSVCSIYCAQAHSCSPECVCPAALRGVCPSLALQTEPLHSQTAVCTPNTRLVFLGMLEIDSCYCFYHLVIHDYLINRVIIFIDTVRFPYLFDQTL